MVFKGDKFAIDAARRKIREEYDKNWRVEDPEQIQELVKVALDAEATLKTVVQLRHDEEKDVYRVQHHPFVPMEDATPYKPLPKDFKPGRRGGAARRWIIDMEMVKDLKTFEASQEPI